VEEGRRVTKRRTSTKADLAIDFFVHHVEERREGDETQGRGLSISSILHETNKRKKERKKERSGYVEMFLCSISSVRLGGFLLIDY